MISYSSSMCCPLFLILFIFFVVVPLSCGEKADNYTACSIPYSCGTIANIGYPFWGYDRPKFCGIPSFRISCRIDGNTTIYNVLQNDTAPATVIGINTSSHSIVTSQVSLFERCHTKNSTLVSHFKPEAGYEEIRLFYGCSNCDEDSSSYQSNKSFTCTYSNGAIGTAYYFGNNNPSEIRRRIGGNNKSCSCSNHLTFPVDKRALDELRRSSNASLKSVLSKWPATKMKYVNFSVCSKCEDSGGRCGSTQALSPAKHFVCFCPDGTDYQLMCGIAGTYPSGWRNKIKIIASGSVAALILGMVMMVAVINCAKRRSTTGDQNVEAFLKSYGSLAPKRYTYANIKKMTNSFKEKLGEGGYGSVYKGKLSDGRLLAVKKMKNLKGDGKDFINEVLSISKTNHVNVVTLLGFCVEGTKRALVYEFLPNGSLEKFMYGKEISRSSLHWDTMLNIALGIARGLDYLHRGCTTRILHFDIKPHNILLDDDFCPKISDFGLARLCSPKKSMITMSEARGTIGYIAPEVFCRNFGGVSHKSDVYSYGMMLLDLVCGRNNLASNAECSSEMYFPEWIYNQLELVTVDDTIQGRIEIDDDGSRELKRKMILVSLWCIQTYPSNRPPMNRVVEMLEGSLESLQMPSKPQWSSSSAMMSDCSSPRVVS